MKQREIRIEKRRKFRLAVGLCLFICLGMIALSFGLDPEKQAVNSAWLWKPREYFTRPVEFCKTAGAWNIRRVFAQVDVQNRRLADQESLRSFLRNARSCGVEVHALGGDPAWAERGRLSEPQALIDAVAEFNRSGEERFTGVHFDVEPYLLPRFTLQPQRVLEEYLGMVSAAADSAREKNLLVGFSIPFFLDTITELRGEKRSAYEHVIRRSDLVALMAYRTRLDGANGIMQLSEKIRNTASSTQTAARILLGIELTAGTSRLHRFACSLTPPAKPEALEASYKGYHVRLLRPGRIYLLGLVQTLQSEQPPAGTDILEMAAGVKFAITSDPEVMAPAVREISATRDFTGVTVEPMGTAYSQPFSVIRCTDAVTSGVSLAGWGRDAATSFAASVADRLVDGNIVEGIAFHDFEALERLNNAGIGGAN